VPKRKVIIVSAILAFCFGFSFLASAQTYYYFENETPIHAGVVYKTLLSLEADGSATARIQYTAGPDHTLYLYQLNLTDSVLVQNADDKRYLMCKSQPVPLVGYDGANFLQPRFIFKKVIDTSSYYYVPAGIEVMDSTGKWIAVTTTQSKEKTYEELQHNEPFVSSFYFETDAFYQYLFNDKVRSTVTSRPEKMFLITVANTNDETIGKSAAVDLQNVNTLFSSIALNIGITKIIPLQISGTGYSKLAVLAALKALAAQKPSGSDIIIFYFSGHGFRLPGDVSAYPNLSFRTPENRKDNVVGDYIPLEEVYNQLMALNPRVCMVFGDCCNASIYENPVFGTDVLKPKGGGTLGDFNVETAKKLFLPTVPLSMLVGSVQKGHLSVGNTSLGGYFTHFFTAELEKNLWGYYSGALLNFGGASNAIWMRILLAARENTYWKAKAKQCGATENDRCIQQAEIKISQ
jgi:hypothetical protein